LLEICDGDSVLLTGSFGYTYYKWSDGVYAQSRFASKEGRYTLFAYDSVSCQESETLITIRHFPSTMPRISAAITEVCEGDSVRLDYVGTVSNFTWSTGERTETIYVKQSGTYTVSTVDEYGCTKTSLPVSVVVHPTPKPTISANRKTTICLDEFVTLTASDGYQSYVWSTGSTERSITVNEAAVYTVTVIDQFGCTGTSTPVGVIVLDTRNKVEVQAQLPGGVFEIPGAGVGNVSCRSISIRNRSLTENLVISNPTFVGNVFFSIPQAQLPVIIRPQELGELRLCSSPVDTGFVFDTLIITDTCSPTKTPVSCFGQPIEYTGTSRCELPVDVLVVRAGVSHYLAPPYPLPANEQFTITVLPPIDAQAFLVDALGVRVASGIQTTDGVTDTFTFNTTQVAPGSYMVVVQTEGAPDRGYPVLIVR
jgi:hypothetical protein